MVVLRRRNCYAQRGASIDLGPDFEHGRTAPQAAAGGGHLDVVKFLIEEYEANVNQAAGIKYGRTALQAAAECGNLDIIKLLLDNGADVGTYPADKYGVPAFQVAALGADVDAMELLLSEEG